MGRNYGCLAFIGDVIMTIITGGFWLIWIYVREQRRKRQYYYIS